MSKDETALDEAALEAALADPYARLHRDTVILAIRTYLSHASLRTEPVAVKPLEWKTDKWLGIGTKGHHSAKTVVGRYGVIQVITGNRAGKFTATFDGYEVSSPHATSDEAKAAAQADYEARILATLDVEPTPSSRWLPISEAPKDGTYVLLNFDNRPPTVARWLYGVWQAFDVLGFIGSPTHWQPLPQPPQTDGGSDDA